MGQSTSLTNIPFPSENDDPWFAEFEQMASDIDLKFAAVLASAGNIIVPPASVLWNSSSGQLTWSDDFIMPILGSGFLLKIQFGPDQATRLLALNDGDKVIVVPQFNSASDVTANFKVVSGKIAYQSGLFIFGMRYGTRFVCNIPQVFS